MTLTSDFVDHLRKQHNLVIPYTQPLALLLQEFEKQSRIEWQSNNHQYCDQFQSLIKNLDSKTKISVLYHNQHRALILQFVKLKGIKFYRPSYYNRAKPTIQIINLLQRFGPILFSEAVMIASRTNLINKSNSRSFTEDHIYSQSESPIDMKIQQILRLCDLRKKFYNNNFRKVQLILQGPESIEVIKKMGKMLRDSWKKQKGKYKYPEIVKSSSQESLVDQVLENLKSCKKYSEFSFTSSQKMMIQQYHNQQQLSKELFENSYPIQLNNQLSQLSLSFI